MHGGSLKSFQSPEKSSTKYIRYVCNFSVSRDRVRSASTKGRQTDQVADTATFEALARTCALMAALSQGLFCAQLLIPKRPPDLHSSSFSAKRRNCHDDAVAENVLAIASTRTNPAQNLQRSMAGATRHVQRHRNVLQ